MNSSVHFNKSVFIEGLLHTYLVLDGGNTKEAVLVPPGLPNLVLKNKKYTREKYNQECKVVRN